MLHEKRCFSLIIVTLYAPICQKRTGPLECKEASCDVKLNPRKRDDKVVSGSYGQIRRVDSPYFR